MTKPKYQSWTCGLCGEPVIEGQRMVVLKNYGYVHIDCFYEYLKNKYPEGVPKDVIALSDVNEVLAYAIVRMKQAEKIASKEVSDFIRRIRKNVEDLTSEIDSALSGQIGL